MALAAPAPGRYPAPAKLNLLLHVLGRRADGMHELQTVFRLIDRCDRIGISVRDDGAIRFDGVFGNQNLCVRAAESLKARSGTALGCEIALEKIVPVGGGLGGGSSDAATTLIVLNRLWGANLSRDQLMEMGARLGADVPFFLLGSNALGEGVGERLTALDLAAAWYLVLTPQVAVSTAEIYSDAALTRDTKRLKIPPFLSGQGRNDLESVATRRHPEIAEHLAWLRRRAAQARMTGSGACVFAEFADEQAARALERALPPAMRGFVARGLERHPLHDWIPE
ncbi:MAG TPA: 4-(cytidine 5'-diphospho)-2-C-methyl-D-erythritol kinase [Burkholderiales bacterium]|nr:4-(cytidine 5'-diphospho)-2-C-methyl-D-erythritol kinase [Burkholderiales bacterium]